MSCIANTYFLTNTYLFFTHRSTFTQAEKHFVQNRKNKEVCIETWSRNFYFYFITIYIDSTSIYFTENLPYMLNKLIY